MSTFGTTLRKLREAAKLRQRDVADIMGVSTSFISVIEKGEREASWDRRALAALALELEDEAGELIEAAVRDRLRGLLEPHEYMLDIQ